MSALFTRGRRCSQVWMHLSSAAHVFKNLRSHPALALGSDWDRPVCCYPCLFVMFFEKSSLKAVVPLIFLLVILLTTMKFGSSAGILGTLSAAFIFAFFLFEPLLRLGIRDSIQRSNLIWMVVGGVALSELLGGPPLSRPSN